MTLDDAQTTRQLLGRRIRTLREKQHISLRRMGLMSGVDYTYLFDIEHGKANATVEVLAKLASSLDVELWELFFPENAALPARSVNYCVVSRPGSCLKR